MTTLEKLELNDLFEYLSAKKKSKCLWCVDIIQQHVNAKEEQAHKLREEAYALSVEKVLGVKLVPALMTDYQINCVRAHGIIEPERAKTCNLLIIYFRRHDHCLKDPFARDYYRRVLVQVNKLGGDVEEALREEYDAENAVVNKYTTVEDILLRMRQEHINLDRLAKLKALREVIAV